jgi:hypothetical protein
VAGSLSREALEQRRTNFKIICEALGELGGAEMIQELMKGLQVKDVEVILASLQILRKRGVEIPEKTLSNELEIAYNHYNLEGEKETKARLEGYEQHLGKLVSETFEDTVIEMSKTDAVIQFLLSHDFEKRWVKDSFLQKTAEWKIASDPSTAMPLLLKSLQTGSASRQAYAARLIALAKNPTVDKPKSQSSWC